MKKILFYNRSPQLWRGGDMVQLESTMAALRKLGFECDFAHNIAVDIRPYDFVHVFHLNFFWSLEIIRRCYQEKKPYLISAIFYPQLYDVSFELMKGFVNHSVMTFALSPQEKKEIIQYTGCYTNKIAVVSNGVDKSIFTFGRNKQSQRVITVGRVEPEKGQQFAAQACIELGVPYYAVGNVPMNRKLISEYAKQDVHFLGDMSQKEVVRLLHESSIYVCPSLSERQSLGVLEAASCGLPIVDSVFNRGASFLPSSKVVDPRDNQLLKDAILTQLDSADNVDYIPSWEDVAERIAFYYA